MLVVTVTRLVNKQTGTVSLFNGRTSDKRDSAGGSERH